MKSRAAPTIDGVAALLRRARQGLAELPRTHIAIGVIILAILSLTLPTPDTDANVPARIERPLTLEFSSPEPVTEPSLTEPAPVASFPDDQSIHPAKSSTASVTEPVRDTPAMADHEVTVKSGDSLAKIFQQIGLSPQLLYRLVNSSDDGAELARLVPGQVLRYWTDEAGTLTRLQYQKSVLESVWFSATADSFTSERVLREPTVERRFVSGTINSSLYAAGASAGLPDKLIMELANIFGSVVDFVLDIRQGDRFHVLFEEHYLDGELIDIGNIVAADFSNQGEQHIALRYQFENGDTGYYTPEGVSMQRAFLRAPLDFSRISSGFNPSRLHPVLKTVRPHRGIDYAAPRGTPVYAAGDGRVIEAGYNKANGHYVFIQHGSAYVTKYLHLHKRMVATGQRVKQRQVIGQVGSTGYATGPHLHYEFLVNGVHRNPRTILSQLPKAISIADSEKSRFEQQTQGLRLQLAAYTQSTLALLSMPTATP